MKTLSIELKYFVINVVKQISWIARPGTLGEDNKVTIDKSKTSVISLGTYPRKNNDFAEYLAAMSTFKLEDGAIYFYYDRAFFLLDGTVKMDANWKQYSGVIVKGKKAANVVDVFAGIDVIRENLQIGSGRNPVSAPIVETPKTQNRASRRAAKTVKA